MRYAVAALVSLLFVVGGYGYYIQAERSINNFLRSKFEAVDEEVTPEIAAVLDSGMPTKSDFIGYGVMMPDHIVWRFTIGDFLRSYAFCLIVFVCGVSFGVAHWTSPKATQ